MTFPSRLKHSASFNINLGSPHVLNILCPYLSISYFKWQIWIQFIVFIQLIKSPWANSLHSTVPRDHHQCDMRWKTVIIISCLALFDFQLADQFNWLTLKVPKDLCFENCLRFASHVVPSALSLDNAKFSHYEPNMEPTRAIRPKRTFAGLTHAVILQVAKQVRVYLFMLYAKCQSLNFV